MPKYDMFIPQGSEGNDVISLRFDEYEVIRLIDLERETQEQCAVQMDISRTTVAEIYESARTKLADSLVNGKPLTISGGHFRICDGSKDVSASCPYTQTHSHFLTQQFVPCTIARLLKGMVNKMKIAVTYDNENGEIFQHFGHTEQFKLYDIEDGKIANSQVVSADGFGHGALAGFLSNLKVDTLICGGIGGGAQAALADVNIRLYGGVQGNADAAVQELLNSSLSYDPDVHCNHHEEGHACGEHKEGGQSCHCHD